MRKLGSLLVLIWLAACTSPEKVVGPVTPQKTPPVAQAEAKKEVIASSKANNLFHF